MWAVGVSGAWEVSYVAQPSMFFNDVPFTNDDDNNYNRHNTEFVFAEAGILTTPVLDWMHTGACCRGAAAARSNPYPWPNASS